MTSGEEIDPTFMIPAKPLIAGQGGYRNALKQKNQPGILIKQNTGNFNQTIHPYYQNIMKFLLQRRIVKWWEGPPGTLESITGTSSITQTRES